MRKSNPIKDQIKRIRRVRAHQEKLEALQKWNQEESLEPLNATSMGLNRIEHLVLTWMLIIKIIKNKRASYGAGGSDT